MLNTIKNIINFNIYFLLIIFNLTFLNFDVLSQTKESNSNERFEKNSIKSPNLIKLPIDRNYLNNIEKYNFYILGPGDIFFLRLNQLYEVDRTKALGGNYKIDNDGFVTLPRLKRVKVAGLTIREFTDLLNKEFSFYIKNVDVSVRMEVYRPAKIYLDGAVKNPGLHLVNIGIGSPEDAKVILEGGSASLSGSTVFDALRIAGGVNLTADLGNIEITRINSLSNGGGRIKTTINLFDTLDLKNLSQNINIRDGDTIFIPSSKDLKSLGFSKILKSNINPEFINVYISGRVKEPGIKKIFNASTLVDGINISGGAKFLKGKVRFLRYKNDGNIDSREFRFNKRAKRGSYKNPYLTNGDIIFVGETFLSTSSEALNEITDPLRGILSSYSFFKIINE